MASSNGSNRLSCDNSEAIIKSLVAASSAQNYDPAQLVANHPIDAQLLQHENPNNCHDLAPGLPLDKYRLNVDPNPQIVRRKPQDKISYLQQVAVRYLKPPPPPKAGDIVIQELPHRQVAPAPALVVRQAPPKPCTPPPIVLREAPPPPPIPIPGKLVHVPGKTIPPPARKVVVERLPPIPPKPQQIYIERWLPYGQQTQRVRYQPAAPPCVIPDPKNVVIQWESPDVEIHKVCKNLGVINANPREYCSKYGSSLIRSDQLPKVAVKHSSQSGLPLAATHRAPDYPILEGDLYALSYINLDHHGLGFYRNQGSAANYTQISPPKAAKPTAAASSPIPTFHSQAASTAYTTVTPTSSAHSSANSQSSAIQAILAQASAAVASSSSLSAHVPASKATTVVSANCAEQLAADASAQLSSFVSDSYDAETIQE